MLFRFINNKAGAGSCYFKQYSTRLPEINGCEITPVKYRRWIQHSLYQAKPCFLLAFMSRCVKGNVVYSAITWQAFQSIRHTKNINIISWSISSCKAKAIFLFGN